MKNLLFLLPVALFACTPPPDDAALRGQLQQQQAQIDSLRKELAAAQPGLGERMSLVQTHHAKLWYAGLYGNWPLADFELDEIQEQLDAAKGLAATRPEVIHLPMLDPALDSLRQSVARKDNAAFKTAFETLTRTCNDCHVSNHFEFNVITVPTSPPVPNQDFNPQR